MADTPHWLAEPGLQQLLAATRAAGGEARVVGGAVRDFLMDRPGGDIDLASTLPPESTVALAADAGWKTIPTGIAHGTLTLVLPERVVEVTTLRRDVETDGRHAKVAYTDDFAEDAARRDFTINALYMDAEGNITDPTGQGQEDIAHAHLQFIGDADRRIEEDALRTLRYFRFLAQLGWPAQTPEHKACARAVKQGRLATLSGERIAQEMKKLLAAADPTAALAAMASIGMDEALSGTSWAAVSPTLPPDARCGTALGWARLIAMIAPAERAQAARAISKRWRLSSKEAHQLHFLADHPAAPDEAAVKRALYRKEPKELVASWMYLHGQDPDWALAWQPPVFPVTANDLMARGMVQGKELGETLRALEDKWVASNYTFSARDLLA